MPQEGIVDMMELSKTESFLKKLESLIESLRAFEYHKKAIPLAYGGESHYYFDFRRLTGDPEGINATANVLYDEIKKIGDFNSVGGLASGAIPLATAISHISCMRNEKPINSFYVRKEPKKQGLGNMIEGCIRPSVIVVDDVITTGTSAIKAINEVRKAGHEVKHLISIVFRGSDELKSRIENENNIEFHYIFHEKHFTERYEKKHPEVVVNI